MNSVCPDQELETLFHMYSHSSLWTFEQVQALQPGDEGPSQGVQSKMRSEVQLF